MMRYGFCTGFATKVKDRIDYTLLDSIKAAGYDFVEFPLMLTAALSDAAFDELLTYLRKLKLDADVTCNMFPPTLKVTGSQANRQDIAEYLDKAFERMNQLGTYKLVFGSSGARDLPTEMSYGEGIQQICTLLNNLVIPRLQKYDIHLVMEPISRQEANFITSLKEAMEVVQSVQHPLVTLLADSVHMLRDQEDMEYLIEYLPYLNHIHVSELERRLPTISYSNRLIEFLENLAQNGYDKTISFEPIPCEDPDGLAKALSLLKSQFR